MRGAQQMMMPFALWRRKRPARPCKDGEPGWGRNSKWRRHSAGYWMRTEREVTYYAHREAWEQAHGPLPVGARVWHTCGNRACHEPEHLIMRMPK